MSLDLFTLVPIGEKQLTHILSYALVIYSNYCTNIFQYSEVGMKTANQVFQIPDHLNGSTDDKLQ